MLLLPISFILGSIYISIFRCTPNLYHGCEGWKNCQLELWGADPTSEPASLTALGVKLLLLLWSALPGFWPQEVTRASVHQFPFKMKRGKKLDLIF